GGAVGGEDDGAADRNAFELFVDGGERGGGGRAADRIDDGEALHEVLEDGPRGARCGVRGRIALREREHFATGGARGDDGRENGGCVFDAVTDGAQNARDGRLRGLPFAA